MTNQNEGYYIQKLQLPSLSYPLFHPWYVDEQKAYRLGIPDLQNSLVCYFEAKDGKSVWDVMKSMTPWFNADGVSEFVKSDFVPGQFYPRIARATTTHPSDFPATSPGDRNESANIAASSGQLTALKNQLEAICRTVQPSEKNFVAYGHDIRNLLILACTEVEAQWVGILNANGYKQKSLTTNDYVKLVRAMRLNEYEVGFPYFPDLEPIKPFGRWSETGKPTQDLQWYAAYNAVKHDRESNFYQATLRNTIEAIAACYVMLVAQYGLPHSGPNARS